MQRIPDLAVDLMDEFDGAESEFSLGGLPQDFGTPNPAPGDSENFPDIPGYVVTGLLGEGGMGAVYEATTTGDPSFKVAIKTIFLQRFQTIAPATLQRFEREVDLLRGIQHPNIVPILDHGNYEKEFQPVPYFSMPLMPAGDLSEWFVRSPIGSKDDLRSMVERLCGVIEGLAAVHRKGVVHRDIKPRNIFVAVDGGLILGDFGLAKILEEDSELTSTIGHLGTTPYAPPEQLVSAKLADARADIYALGVILYQFACFGLRPFAPDDTSAASQSETDSIAQWQRSSNRTPPKPSLRNKHLSDPSFDFIVQKCIAYYPEFRYQTADDLLGDLRAWLNGDSVRGNFAEQIRNRILVPIRPYWKRLVAVFITAALAITFVTAYQFNLMTRHVSQLTEDVSKERKERQRELRVELASILPKLKGESLDYEIRRLTNPEAEFEKLRKRADEISRELELKNSDRFEDRHWHWVIQRTSGKGSPSREYSAHVRSLCDSTEKNLDLVSSGSSSTERFSAVSDVLRSRRMMLEILWFVQEHETGSDLQKYCDSEQLMADCQQTLERLNNVEWVVGDSAIKKHLDLLLLEIAIKDNSISPVEAVELCRANLEMICTKSLRQAGCQAVHPWSVAWYIFELYYETTKRLGRPPAEREMIVNHWYELQSAMPMEAKQQNITYQADRQVVRDRHHDVLRDSGRVKEALRNYEEDWQSWMGNLKFYRHDRKAWDVAEQVVASMIELAVKQDDTQSAQEFYLREQTLLRDKRIVVMEHPDWFLQDEPFRLRFNLARSLFQSAQLAKGDAKHPLLEEADGLVTKNLVEQPNHQKSNGLSRAIRQQLHALDSN